MFKLKGGGIVGRPSRIGNTFIGSQTDLGQYGYYELTTPKPTDAPEGQMYVDSGNGTYDEQAMTYTPDWVLVDKPEPPAPVVTLGVLEVSKYAIAADGVDVSIVTYTSDNPVPFVLDDELVEVEPVNQVATLNVSADDFGPINVFVKGSSATISAYKVSP